MLEKLTVKELKERAKARGMKGYSKLSKPELIAVLRGSKDVKKQARQHANAAVRALKEIEVGSTVLQALADRAAQRAAVKEAEIKKEVPSVVKAASTKAGAKKAEAKAAKAAKAARDAKIAAVAASSEKARGRKRAISQAYRDLSPAEFDRLVMNK